MIRQTTRWRGGVAAALVVLVAGVAVGRASLVLAALVPLVYVAWGSASGVRVPELTVERSVEPTPAPPGSPVWVRLRVTNDGAHQVSDLRVIDGVPRDLAVMRGTPRAGTALEPGETCEVIYSLVARRGEHAFARPRIEVRGVGAGAVATVDVAVAGDEALDCRLDADAPPLADQGNRFVGHMTADDPGKGLTFHSTREYRSTDPADRINWRYYAKRNELGTVNYERHVSATVVLVVDARRPCHVVPGPGRPTAVELAGYAATHAVTSLLASGHDVAVAVVGADGPGPAGLYWLPPGGGSGQRSRALELFRRAASAHPRSNGDPNPDSSATASHETDPESEPEPEPDSGRAPDSIPSVPTPESGAASTAESEAEAASTAASESGTGPTPGSERATGRDPNAAGGARARRRRRDPARQFSELVELAPPGSQLALFSPLLDDVPVDAVATWRAYGFPAVVLSPDVVSANTVSGQFEHVRRRARLARCQAAGARTFDWLRGTPLPLALSYAFAAEARVAGAAQPARTGGGR